MTFERVIFWPILGRKGGFLTFSKLFCSCSESVMALYSDSNCLMYSQLKRLVFDLQTEIFGQHLAFKEGDFDNFQAQKSRFLDFF